MKENFLNELRKELKKYDFTKEEIEDIVSDYNEMYEDKYNSGYNDFEIVEDFGDIDKLVSSLGKTTKSFVVEKNSSKMEQLVSISIFLTVIIYVIIGNLGFWHPGWLIFSILPILQTFTANNSLKDRIIKISFILTIVFYLGIGFLYAWHPFWMIFIFPNILQIWLKDEDLNKKFTASVVLIAPFILFILLHKYYYSGPLLFLLFIIPIFIGIWCRNGYNIVSITINGDIKSKKYQLMSSFVLLIIAFYFIISSLFKIWHLSWIIFLFIPIIAILLFSNENKARIIGVMVFVVNITFFILGFLFGLWGVAWVLYLTIPILAILID